MTSSSRPAARRGESFRSRSGSRIAPTKTGVLPAPEKRLILACDGTWVNADNGLRNGQLLDPSNVARIGWAVKDESDDGIPQVVYYQAGVGSRGSFVDRLAGGIAAVGIAEHIREAYTFLANNYTVGDEIFLIGFSRGAFTARSVASLIDCVGLLTKKGLPDFGEIFKDFEHRTDRNYRPRYPDIPFPDKPNINDPYYSEELARHGLTTLDIPIKVVGVFDTVGALGIPRIGLLEKLGLHSKPRKEYSFNDTVVPECVQNAFQALALDERRAAFVPAVWEKPRGSKTNLKQVWFPGVHANIGGGYPDQELANITLAWMIAQLKPFIDFQDDYIYRQCRLNDRYYRQTDQEMRPWAFGKIYNSLTGMYAAGGTTTRTPGFYRRYNSITGRKTSKYLHNTNEYIHASVRARTRLDGPGIDDRGLYESDALRGWRIVRDNEGDAVPQPLYLWRAPHKRKVIPESALRGTELELLKESPDVEDFIMEYAPRRSNRSLGNRVIHR